MIIVQNSSSEVILKCIVNLKSSLNGMDTILWKSYVTLHQNTYPGNSGLGK